MEKETFYQLIDRYQAGTASLQEQALLETYYHQLTQGRTELEPGEELRLRTVVLDKILAKTIKQSVPMYKKVWIRYAAAAVFIAAMVFTGKLLFRDKRTNQSTVVHADVKAPQTNRAMVTLADGKTVYLDSVGNGKLATLGSVELVKLADGKIAYNENGGGNAKEISYNTLTNPRGSKAMDMTLADGTQVWLNAGSSITYPIAFVGGTRKVTITGEVYFQVNHDGHIPFTVRKDNMQVTVYGTHFNVKAYDDEAFMKVTLLEGSVSVTQNAERKMLIPGQQAQIGNNIQILDGIDTEEVMAWKDGKFRFGEKADIQTIMREIGRWYDMDVEYRGSVNNHFWGTISRDVNASEVFKKLEATGGVHFNIEGKKVIVMP